MAEYKVPQDVEADDKLIGPFSFRQFIYLIIVALSCAAAWGLWQLFIPLAIIPLPVIIFFGALALPLRKDQPMEVYLAAMVSFYLKPRKRLWEADGIDSLIEITVPKTVEVQRTKNISQGEAQQRFGYLAEIVDSQGWAVRGQGVQAPNSAMNTDVYLEAQQAEDILDSSNNVAQSLDYMIGKSDVKRREDMVERLHQQAASSTVTPAPAPNPFNFFASQNAPIGVPPPRVEQPVAYTPPTPGDTPSFATAIPTVPAATIVPTPAYTPLATVPVIADTTTSEKVIAPGIIELANNADLSIETIAHEANRINQQQDMNEEVVISLR